MTPAEILAVLAAMATVTGTLLGVGAGYLGSKEAKEAQENLRRSEADKRREIQAAQQAADVEIARFGAVAAQANEKTGELEREAAAARLETERLRERMAWRSLTAEQSRLLTENLRGHRMHIAISVIAGDPEADAYASQLMEAMDASRSVSGDVTPTLFTGPVIGLRMSQTDSPEARSLERALRAANIPFTFSSATPELRMSIGTKPVSPTP